MTKITVFSAFTKPKPIQAIQLNYYRHLLERYFRHKANALRDAIQSNTLSPVCSFRERWGDKK
ncbi:MAG: hypothetical protein IJQ82_05365 [Selenomonadaceae bacterium]|nr:hypothetical protein [Selenomonadaceae bacterium]